MPDPFDALFEAGGSTEPPAAFRREVMAEVRAALSAPRVHGGVRLELEPAESPGPRRGGAGHRGVRVALVLAAASAMVVALVVARDRPTRDDSSASPGGLPRNGWLAFSEADSTGDLDIYLVREGRSPRRIAGSDTDASTQACPAFSPNGERLVFGQMTGTTTAGFENDAQLVINTVGADGLTGDPTTISVAGLSAPPCPMWSPDGRWLAFGAGTDVWLVDSVTEELRRVSGHAATDLDWRPGTEELAIADNGIHIYSAATDQVRSLDVEGATQLAWSPDGTRLAVARLRSGASAEARYEATLFLVDSDGAVRRQIATYASTHGVGPVWSPDGRYIAYQRKIDGRCCEVEEVVLVGAGDGDGDVGTDDDGDVVISPPTTPGSDRLLEWYPWSATWSPDGRMLLYIAWNDACAAIVPDVEPEGTVADQDLDGRVSAECRARPAGSGILAVPVDTTKAPFLVADPAWHVGVQDGHPWLPMQSWGPEPGS